MPKILLLVHVEETFRRFFTPNLLDNIADAVESGEFDEVIHFTSNVNDDTPVEEIAHLMDEDVCWGWGYEPEVFEHQPEEIPHVIESIGHAWTWVPPELREWADRLRGSDIVLGGGYHCECLADMESVFRHLNIDYVRRQELIY